MGDKVIRCNTCRDWTFIEDPYRYNPPCQKCEERNREDALTKAKKKEETEERSYSFIANAIVNIFIVLLCLCVASVIIYPSYMVITTDSRVNYCYISRHGSLMGNVEWGEDKQLSGMSYALFADRRKFCEEELKIPLRLVVGE